MSLTEHLEELRSRLLYSLLALIVGIIAGLVVADPVLEYLIEPYASLYPEGERELIVLGPTGGITVYLRVALLAGGVIAVPMVTYQLLLFILPGLTRKERRYVVGSFPAIVGLFIGGVLFAWFILIPPAIHFLEGFQGDIFRPTWAASQYLGFITSLLFWMGVAFEVPLVFFILAVLELVEAKTLIHNWRGAIVATAVAAALITPTVDPVNMFLVMGPLLGLYVVSIVLVAIGQRIGG